MKNIEPIRLNRGVTQGDKSCQSCSTNQALEDIFKRLNWGQNVINKHGEYLNHLIYADDVLITGTKEELELAI